MKAFKLFVLIFFFALKLNAQDAVLISEGNFVRGIIKGTNYSSVAILEDDNAIKEYQAKNIHSFVWNGETYVSKPIVIKKKMEFRFFRLLEGGKVNLYAFGSKAITEQPAPAKTRVRPTFGVGLGSGGFGGGLGGGISIGGGGNRRNDEQVINSGPGKVTYFIEKPGTGPMQEVNLGNTTAVKNILLIKLDKDDDLAESIKATEGFDEKNLTAYVKAYNTKL